MWSQSGTFYKIIVTCLLLGVDQLPLSTGSPAVDTSKEAVVSKESLNAPSSIPSGAEPLTSASSANITSPVLPTLKEGDGAPSDASSSGPSGSLNLVSENKEKLPVAAVAPKEPAKEVLLTAAQSYFIEPPTSTTTTQRPTFKKRKTRRPISALTENKKKPPVDNNADNNLQGNPVPFNPFRQIMNTQFGKTRPSSAEGKFGGGRQQRNRPNLSRPSSASAEQTGSGSPINDKINEIPSSTTESESRPSFNRRRPLPLSNNGNNKPQRPSFSANNDKNSDNSAASADATSNETPRPRRFPTRKPKPSENGSNNNKNSDDNTNAADTPVQRTFKRIRPTSTAAPKSGENQEDDSRQTSRRVRPIRPIVGAGRLTNRQPTTTTSTTTTTTTTTSTTAAPEPEIPESPFPGLLGFPENPFFAGLNNHQQPNISQPFPPLTPEIPEHISNIINGIAPLSIHPSKPELEVQRLPSIRGGAAAPETEGKQGFVLRPRASTTTSSKSLDEGENDGASPRPVQRRRKRPLTTTEGPEVVEDHQRFTGGIVGSAGSRTRLSNPSPPRGGIPDGAVPRNPTRVLTRQRVQENNSENSNEKVPAPVHQRDRTAIRGLTRISASTPSPQREVVTPDRLPNSPRGRVPPVGLPRNTVNSYNPSAFQGGIVDRDIPESPVNPENPFVPSQGGIIIPDIITGTPGIPSSPRGRIPEFRNIPNSPINRPESENQGGIVIPDILGNNENIPLLGERIPNLGYSGNPLNPPAFRGGIVSGPGLSSFDDNDNSLQSLVEQKRPIPPLVRAKPIEVPTSLPFPPLPHVPSVSSFSNFPQSYQIRDEGPFLEPLIPNINTAKQPELPKTTPTLLREAPLFPPTNRPAPVISNVPRPAPINTDFPRPGPINNNFPIPAPINNNFPLPAPINVPRPAPINGNFPRPAPINANFPRPMPINNNFPRPGPIIGNGPRPLPGPVRIPNNNFINNYQPPRPAAPLMPMPTNIVNNVPRKPNPAPSPLAAPIHQSLNAAMNPKSSNFPNPPGLFQVPPKTNLRFYPGLDNVLGVSSNFKTVQRKPGRNPHRFSSRTTIVPEEQAADGLATKRNNNDRSTSASNENQSVVFAEISDSPPSENPDIILETNQPDLTTVTATTTTTTAPEPTKRLSPLQKLQKNRQAAARRFLTPRKPTEKTTSSPIANKKPVNSLRKSVIPPRTLKTRGKSSENIAADVTSKQDNSGENVSEVNNASVAIPSTEPDTSSNVIPGVNQEVEVEQKEVSTRKPTLLEKARRRRIPIPRNSSPSPVQQHKQKMNRVTSAPLQNPENTENAQPDCEEGHRYSKFLKRCIVMYKPKAQG